MQRRTLLTATLLAAPFAALAVPARAQRLRELLAGTGLGANRFVELATIGHNFEIDSSQYVLSRTNHPQIRDFAQRMVTDHTALRATLAALPEASSRAGATLDDAATRKLITLRDQTDLDLLHRYYVQQQIEAHEDAVELYEAYSGNGEVTTIKAYAAQYLPMLREHLAAARALQAPPAR
jgi:putative membrane protein